jgi:uncharacterized membrane protein YhaH (DUF805 family)
MLLLVHSQNPYQAPKSTTSVDLRPYGQVNVFDARGRLGRVRYLTSVLVASAVIVFASVMAADGDLPVQSPVTVIALTSAYLWLTSQRCHDVDRSAWFSLVALIPGMFFVFCISDDTPGANRYGKANPPNSMALTIFATFAAVTTCLFLLALAIAASVGPGPEHLPLPATSTHSL